MVPRHLPSVYRPAERTEFGRSYPLRTPDMPPSLTGGG